ncbi:MAG: bifunctional diaminohydroxyphosphoribosylaminopyrimidine deaminase/5-amino-6-(5-phosphoribosylamino)uracil reductase RibD [Bacteroidetes bacterium]|nr:bifunctional diaminohydroxyphosphoribosylaminopyrimidine deaminase/5-amino-6-(5-phosphoribosylamino)uracil reductase RibD [Bacteroidota bacterium]
MHEYYMSRCIELAKKGAGRVSPNPMVGSVLVFGENIIGEGFHQQYGEAHAEVNCIHSVSADNRIHIPDSVLYVCLEPCSHYGKTPPCVDLILAQKIRKVVIGCKDFSSTVNGKGIQKLKDHGVEVIENVLEKEALELNKRFFTFHQKQRPFIILKWAQSKDGFIGKLDERIKLSEDATDTIVHQWRAEEDAIWVGWQTAKTDNPKLNVRHVEGRNPIRIVYDRDLSLPSELNFFKDTQSTICFNNLKSETKGNVEWIDVLGENYIHEILQHLYQRNILSVLVEGGSKLIQQFIDKNLWDEARCIQTNTLLGTGIKVPEMRNHKTLRNEIIATDEIVYYFNSERIL